ncbi:MAG TPA: hypothetical protein VMS63_09455 [Gaiellaceae bacterium]|nr:hypothetical protein [Gaiellaceae bacterium]
MSASGPLVAHWRALELAPVQAGALHHVIAEVENAGTATWRTRGVKEGLFLAYHWLDERSNPIVWDGLRTPLERTVGPGETLRQQLALRAPIPPGRYRLAVDLVEEHRFWLAELGNTPFEKVVDVLPRDAAGARAFLPAGVEAAPDWLARVHALHAEGYAAVGGAIEPERGLRRRAASELAPYAPGGGRHPRFPHPLVCPSLLPPLEPNDEIAGLPAYRPEGGETWMFDGRIVLTLRSRSGRRRD